MANQTLIQWQLAWPLAISGTEVDITNDTVRDEEGDIINASCVLRNRAGTVFELTKATVSANTVTFSKRWLTKADEQVEDVSLKKSWKKWDFIYVTVLASDIIAKDKETVWGASQDFTGYTQNFWDTTHSGSTNFIGTTVSGLTVKNVTTAQRLALAAENGDIVYDTDIWVLYQYIGWGWASFASGAVVTATNSTQGKVYKASTANQWASTAWVYAVVTENLVKTSSWASDENKVPVLDSGGSLWLFLPTGLIHMWTTATAPTGWLLCNWASISNDTYADLLDLFNDWNFVFWVGTTANAFTADNATDTFTDNWHWLNDWERVYIRNSWGAIPTGLTADTIYFVISADTNTFQLSLTSGGSAVTISDDGSWTQNRYSEFKIPDMQGNVAVGKDSWTFATLWWSGGEETHVLTEAELAAHTHGVPYKSYSGGEYNKVVLWWTNADQYDLDTDSTWGDTAHNNIQPYLVMNYIIKI